MISIIKKQTKKNQKIKDNKSASRWHIHLECERIKCVEKEELKKIKFLLGCDL